MAVGRRRRTRRLWPSPRRSSRSSRRASIVSIRQEKRALQLASIIGERFDLAEVATLAEDAGSVALDALERKGLILEDREAGGAGAMRFKHLLIREVAYASLAKADRAPLHERFATALAAEAGDRREEFAEILAHHAEQAFTLSAELRLPQDVLVPRAARAGAAALALAERAEQRGDLPLMQRFLSVADRATRVAKDAKLTDRNEFLRIRALLLAGNLKEARPAAIAALAAARATEDVERAAVSPARWRTSRCGVVWSMTPGSRAKQRSS